MGVCAGPPRKPQKKRLLFCAENFKTVTQKSTYKGPYRKTRFLRHEVPQKMGGYWGGLVDINQGGFDHQTRFTPKIC